MVISTWALAEASAVLALKVRQGVLTASQRDQAERRVALLAANPLLVLPTEPADVIEARSLVLAAQSQRAADALHLAIALRLSLEIATFDEGLKQAASAAGCGVVAL